MIDKTTTGFESTGFDSNARTADFRDPRTLLMDYIDICNQAIDTRIFEQLERLGEKYGKPLNMHTIIYDRDPGDVVASALIRFNPMTPGLEMLPAADYEARLRWKAPLDYLEDVVLRRPDWYLENPLRLDWSWMKERARDELAYRLDVPSLVAGVAVGAIAGLLLGWGGKKMADRNTRYLQDEINRLSEYEDDWRS